MSRSKAREMRRKADRELADAIGGFGTKDFARKGAELVRERIETGELSPARTTQLDMVVAELRRRGHTLAGAP